MTVHQSSTLRTIAILITYPQPIAILASEDSSGNTLLLQLIEEIGCDGDPHEDHQPNTSSENVVVVEQVTPRTLRHIMSKQEFKGDCHAEPHQTNNQGLPG